MGYRTLHYDPHVKKEDERGKQKFIDGKHALTHQASAERQQTYLPMKSSV